MVESQSELQLMQLLINILTSSLRICKLFDNSSLKPSLCVNLQQGPGNAATLLFSPLNPTLQLATCNLQLLKKACGKLIPSLRCNVLNVRRGVESSDEAGRRIHEVLLFSLQQLDTLLLPHSEEQSFCGRESIDWFSWFSEATFRIHDQITSLAFFGTGCRITSPQIMLLQLLLLISSKSVASNQSMLAQSH